MRLYYSLRMHHKLAVICHTAVVIMIEAVHKCVLEVGGKLLPLGHSSMTCSINCAATSRIALLSSGECCWNCRCRLIRYAVQIGGGCIS